MTDALDEALRYYDSTDRPLFAAALGVDVEPVHHEPSPQDLIAWPEEDK